jgi:hypothetical protein
MNRKPNPTSNFAGRRKPITSLANRPSLINSGSKQSPANSKPKNTPSGMFNSSDDEDQQEMNAAMQQMDKELKDKEAVKKAEQQIQ